MSAEEFVWWLKGFLDAGYELQDNWEYILKIKEVLQTVIDGDK